MDYEGGLVFLIVLQSTFQDDDTNLPPMELIALSLDDRRTSRRIDVGNRFAQIDFRDGSPRVGVCLWNISRGGACLLVSHKTSVPETFDLIIDGIANPVIRVWRQEIFVGLKFCEGPEPHGGERSNQPAA
jgi:hypothetical protein